MRYFQPYTFLKSSSHTAATLFYLSVLAMVPFLGVLVILGYRAELADEWDDRPDDRPVREFRFDRFSELVTRGLWPFLYFLIQAGIWFAGYMLTYFSMVIILLSQGGKPDGAFVLATFGGWALSIGFLWYFTMFISWPFVLYSSRVRQFAFGDSCGFAKDFYARVGWLMVGLLLPKALLDGFLYIAGYACCFVGLLPASVLIMLAEQHFLSQLYRRYLERGGSPIPAYQPPDRPVSDEQ